MSYVRFFFKCFLGVNTLDTSGPSGLFFVAGAVL